MPTSLVREKRRGARRPESRPGPAWAPPHPQGSPFCTWSGILCQWTSRLLRACVSVVGRHLGTRKDHQGFKMKENDENCGPANRTFVGDTSEKAPDMLVRQLAAKSFGFGSSRSRNCPLCIQVMERRSCLLELMPGRRHTGEWEAKQLLERRLGHTVSKDRHLPWGD
uniref:Uncharacterized protein n=1 Tax=Canis lupus familiaris TaxID=9615 RepID=A0A8C0RPZ6_CANLF